MCGAGLIRPVPEGTGESRRWFPKGRSFLREYSRNDAKGAVLLRENVARGLPVAAARLEKAKGFHLLLCFADAFSVLLAGFSVGRLRREKKEKNKTDNGSPCKILKENVFPGNVKSEFCEGISPYPWCEMPKERNKERGERGGCVTMRTKRFALRFVAAAAMVLLLAGAAWCADVALTSVGQSPDATMVKVVLKKLKVENDHDNLFTPEKLAGQKVLLAVVGGSSKGLGAAGIDKDQEKARAVGLIEAAKEKGMKVLVLHVGGAGRRGQLTDMFIEAVVPLADALIVVKGGNDDGLFGRLIEGKNVPFTEVPTVRDTEGPLGEFLKQWGVL